MMDQATMAEGQTQAHLEARTEIRPGSSPGRGTIDLEYVTADLCGDASGLTLTEMKKRRRWPQGKRGYLVISTGDAWATLFSPVSLRSYRVPSREYETMRGLENHDFDAPAMLARIEANRASAIKYGRYDGGRNAARAIDSLRSWIADGGQ